MAAQYRSKLWINDIYTCIRTFVKFGVTVTRPSQKKVVKAQSWDLCIFAGDFVAAPPIFLGEIAPFVVLARGIFLGVLSVRKGENEVKIL